MSNTLNEKFEEFATAQADVLKEYQDPMPTVTATVVPGTGSENPTVSGDPQQASSGKDEPSGSDPKVPEAVANGQSRNDLGGSQSPPLHAAKGEGVKLGVSSRGMGSIDKREDCSVVMDDFMLATAADIVADPSAPDAFVNGIMEGKEWVWDNGILKETKATKYQRYISNATRQNLEERTLQVFDNFLSGL